MIGARLARRELRRMWRRLAPARARLVYSARYELSLSGLPLDVFRSAHILAFLGREGLIDKKDVALPEPASMHGLRLVHHDDYLDSLHEPAVLGAILGLPLVERDVDRVLELQRLMSGGTIAAATAALSQHTIGVNLGGGFHHARPDRGHGFCIFNDVALAIAHLRETRFRGRVMVIDLDLHDGDGTRICFAEDPTVHTFSIHNQTWDERPAIEATTIELGAEIDDATYLGALERSLPERIARFDPGLVFYVAGTDPAIDDRIGNWKISAQGMLARDRRVVELVRATGRRPLAIVLGGGYGQESWRYSARFLAWLLSGEVIEPPSTTEATLLRLREVARLLDPRELSGTADFVLTAEDLSDGLGIGPPRNRFLDFYTTQGIELALERHGLLAQLRALGFGAPTLELEVDPTHGDLLRIYGDAAKRELLIELRARRDRRTLPEMELLAIEWLLLQNPRLPFGPQRVQLPGQRHPGLGMLPAVIGLLVMVAERLGLDGLIFVPTHYHSAAQSRAQLAFLHPEDERRFDAILRAAGDRPIEEVSWALERGELTDETGAKLEWRPAPMILPVTERLRERVRR